MLRQVVGDGLTTYDRDSTAMDHTAEFDAAVWGCLSNCTAGEAKVLFRQSGRLEGIDAWRRIIRLIDNGRDLRLEQFRMDVRMIRAHPIRSREHARQEHKNSQADGPRLWCNAGTPRLSRGTRDAGRTDGWTRRGRGRR